MSTLLSMVNKTQVNYETSFIYSIDLSVSELDKSINTVKLTTLIPSYIDFIMPISQISDETITAQPVTDGTNIIIEISNIGYKATARNYELKCKFKYLNKIPPYTSITNSVNMYIDDVLTASTLADTVNLVINPNFTLTKSKVVPIGNPASREPVIWEIRLQNIGDKGGTISDVVITDIMPTGITIITEYTVVGKDVSDNEFADISADGIVGVYGGNSLTFKIPPNITYGGTDYVFFIIARVDSDIGINTQILNSITWTVNGIEKSSPSNTITISRINEEIFLQLTGPNYISIGEKISYDLAISNIGNADISNGEVSFYIPNKVIAYKLKMGKLDINSIGLCPSSTYELFYETNLGNTGSLGVYNTDVNNEIDLTAIILLKGEVITQFYTTFTTIPVGAKFVINPSIDGTVQDTSLTIITNHIQFTYIKKNGEVVNVYDQQYTNINANSELKTEILSSDKTITVQPGSIIRCGLRANCDKSRVKQPILSTMLPNQCSFYGNVRYVYYDYFNDILMDSVNPLISFTIPKPTAEVIDNYKNTGKQLVRFSYIGLNTFTLNQKDYLDIEFDVKIAISADTTVLIKCYLGNYGSKGVVSDGVDVYEDVLDIDGDNILSKYIATIDSAPKNLKLLPLMNTIEDITEVNGKSVLDSHTQPVKTGLSQTVKYKLTVINIGEKDLTDIDIVDLLPSIGDSSVLNSNIPRGSEYNLNLLSDITTNVYPAITGENPTYTIEYSQNIDPTRFNTGSVNDWNTRKPSDLSKIRAFRVYQNTVPLRVGQTLEVVFELTTPAFMQYGLSAFNSFGVNTSFVDDVLKEFIPVEPTMLEVILEDDTNASSISGVVFNDKNQNGIFDINEQGLNGINVALYVES